LDILTEFVRATSTTVRTDESSTPGFVCALEKGGALAANRKEQVDGCHIFDRGFSDIRWSQVITCCESAGFVRTASSTTAWTYSVPTRCAFQVARMPASTADWMWRLCICHVTIIAMCTEFSAQSLQLWTCEPLHVGFAHGWIIPV
jgi:hypothetical protein